MESNNTPISRIVFCDFDGTITSQESLEGVFKRFAPDLWKPVKEAMMALEITIREGVRRVLESIPSERYPEILEFVRTIPIRPGFEDMLDFLDEQGVPFVIVSGGLRGMVDARLGNLVKRAYKIFAVDVDTSGEFIQLKSDFEGDTELVAKVDVMNLFDAAQRVMIGDGVTDLNMAKNSSVVFARDNLALFLKHMGVPYKEWSDFFDVVKELRLLWEVR
ncbi:MAG: MtnX-like HAD-IB family phosphatase [Desulfobacterales bacterium]|jgi:2-hydroxy-3-keto-5-methylthiopentenyl-1-phosphate phosphatase|nr:MtnX-like HAD-IB family phosphatase [Desulfobacterales bacterium]